MKQLNLLEKISEWILWTLAELAVKYLGITRLYCSDPRSFNEYIDTYGTWKSE